MDNHKASFVLNLQKGNKAQKKGDLVKALRHFKIAHRREPDHAVTNLAMGTVYVQKEMYGHAVRFIKRSLELDPSVSEAWNNLCVALRHAGTELQAAEAAREGLTHAPDDVPLLTNLGAVCFVAGLLDEAEEVLRRAVALDSQCVDAHWNLGLALLTNGNFKEGWPEYDWGFKAGERIVRPYWDEYPEWLGEDVKDKIVLVWGEQGIGDEILFSSCINQLRDAGAGVVMDCHPRLIPMFKRSFPWVLGFGARKDEDWGWSKNLEIDHHIPSGSLPLMFNLPKEPSTAYLHADPTRVAHWRTEFNRPVIGISWRGGSKKNAIERRSIDLDTFIQPFLGKDVHLVSLQYGDVMREVQKVEKRYGIDLHHELWAIEDYDECAAMTAACDRVITVTTAAGHLAGSLGVPTTALVPKAAPWRWPKGDQHPWYASVKMVHQTEDYEWGPVLARIGEEL